MTSGYTSILRLGSSQQRLPSRPLVALHMWKGLPVRRCSVAPGSVLSSSHASATLTSVSAFNDAAHALACRLLARTVPCVRSHFWPLNMRIGGMN
ncbi:hypothetical protein CALVIDRAFT_244423 [Calocera viscosa TUFC12733]|uniref:Uncharacterized protein n=1 Tax=Calocera viscosa (strain TUFC12733) TaxID=1330018 RepID=A0A167JGI9_CALVF|nr:hypothetical protein CALVIDRAFT_244423 [Calocera viscosa TUFC12733]